MSERRTVLLRHNRITLGPAPPARGRRAGRCCSCTGSARRHRPTIPAWLEAWTGPVAALDFTGHGASSIPTGGGYTSEILLADADIALAALGQATVFGRGLGAFVACMLAGSRPTDVVGAVLADGPGLAGGPTFPTSQSFFALPPPDGPPDPYALVELSTRPAPARTTPRRSCAWR